MDIQFLDLSLLMAITTLLLTALSELTSPKYGTINFIIKRKNLQKIVIIVAFLFFITVIIFGFNVLF